jgi:hypothetical protein
LPIFDHGFVIPSEVEESLIIKHAMHRKKRAKNPKNADRKQPQATSGRQLKRMRGFVRGINTAVRRESDRV